MASCHLDSWALTIAGVAVLIPTVPSLPPLPDTESESKEKKSLPWGLISLVIFLLLAVTGVFAAYTYLGLIIAETAGDSFVSIGLFAFGALGLIGVTVATRTVDQRMLRGVFTPPLCLSLLQFSDRSHSD